MFFGRRTSWQAVSSICACSKSTTLGLLAFSASWLTGCSDTGHPIADAYADYQPAIAWSDNTADITPVANVHSAAAANPSGPYWSFSPDSREQDAQTLPRLALLPEIAEPTSSGELVPEEPAVALPEETTVEEPRLALLPPPQATPSRSIVVQRSEGTAPQLARLPSSLHDIQKIDGHDGLGFPPEASTPVMASMTEQERLLTLALRDATSAATGVPTDNRVNEVAKSKIHHAYAMANRGGMYVARTELIEVLRMISQAKDAQNGTPKRSAALAAGLRALREAEDFEPRGTQLEAEMDIQVLCASHRTPVGDQAENAHLLPRLMMDRYLRYAQLQLALSVAGEPAGSMALHALGKLSSQLGHVEPEKHRLADRHAMAYQQASLLAHNQNYLAAHELAVLLATSGHHAESQQLLLQVAHIAPNAVVLRNLARVQQQLGQQSQAVANRDYARQLASEGATGTNNVTWVSPDQFAQSRVPTPRYKTTQRLAAQPAAAPPATVHATTVNSIVVPGSRQASPAMRRR